MSNWSVNIVKDFDVCYVLCVVNFLSEYTWVAPFKDKKVITIAIAFQRNLDKFRRKTS